MQDLPPGIALDHQHHLLAPLPVLTNTAIELLPEGHPHFQEQGTAPAVGVIVNPAMWGS